MTGTKGHFPLTSHSISSRSDGCRATFESLWVLHIFLKTQKPVCKSQDLPYPFAIYQKAGGPCHSRHSSGSFSGRCHLVGPTVVLSPLELVSHVSIILLATGPGHLIGITCRYDPRHELATRLCWPLGQASPAGGPCAHTVLPHGGCSVILDQQTMLRSGHSPPRKVSPCDRFVIVSLRSSQ
jgi:hypothetical protein